MKIKKMAGALALTAALAMGTTPAFAASVGTDTDTWSPGDKGSTEVKAKVEKKVDPQLNATVPMQITVVFGSTGASDILGPSASAYFIENTGEDDIQVTDAEISGLNELFTNNAVQINSSTGEMNATAGNNLMFYFTTENNNAYLTSGHNASAQTAGSTQNRYFPSDAPAIKWTPEELAAGDQLNITIGGKAYFTDTIAQDQLTDTLCSIKYTIAAL